MSSENSSRIGEQPTDDVYEAALRLTSELQAIQEAISGRLGRFKHDGAVAADILELGSLQEQLRVIASTAQSTDYQIATTTPSIIIREAGAEPEMSLDEMFTELLDMIEARGTEPFTNQTLVDRLHQVGANLPGTQEQQKTLLNEWVREIEAILNEREYAPKVRLETMRDPETGQPMQRFLKVPSRHSKTPRPTSPQEAPMPTASLTQIQRAEQAAEQRAQLQQQALATILELGPVRRVLQITQLGNHLGLSSSETEQLVREMIENGVLSETRRAGRRSLSDQPEQERRVERRSPEKKQKSVELDPIQKQTAIHIVDELVRMYEKMRRGGSRELKITALYAALTERQVGELPAFDEIKPILRTLHRQQIVDYRTGKTSGQTPKVVLRRSVETLYKTRGGKAHIVAAIQSGELLQ